jgi:hypothetical protein
MSGYAHVRNGSFSTELGVVRAMSGLPRIATDLRTSLVVRFVPQADPTTRLASLGILAGLESRMALSMIGTMLGRAKSGRVAAISLWCSTC